MPNTARRNLFWLTALVGAALGLLIGVATTADWSLEGTWSFPPNWPQVLLIYSFAGAFLGAMTRVLRQICRRYRHEGAASKPVRSLGSALVSTLGSAGGLATALWGWNELLAIESWNPFVNAVALFVLGFWPLIAGITISVSCAASLCFLDIPADSAGRCTICATVLSLALIPIWSLLAYQPVRAEAIGSHSTGAGLGAMLILVVIPALVWLLLGAQLVLHLACRPSAAKKPPGAERPGV